MTNLLRSPSRESESLRVGENTNESSLQGVGITGLRIQLHALYPQPSAITAKSFLPPDFYSGATAQAGRFSEGFSLRRLQLIDATAESPNTRELLCRLTADTEPGSGEQPRK